MAEYMEQAIRCARFAHQQLARSIMEARHAGNDEFADEMTRARDALARSIAKQLAEQEGDHG